MKQSIISVIAVLIFVKSSSAIVPTSEFYVDPNGPTDNQPGIGCGVVHSPTLPMTITNLRGIPSESIPVDRLYIGSDGLFSLKASFRIYAWLSGLGCFKGGDNYETTISNNLVLLQRARKEITSTFNVNDPDEVTPTYLIISQFNDARVHSDTVEGQGTTYQAVVATNGQYTYAIIQFASVESGLSGSQITAYTGIYSERKNLPYNDMPSEAGNRSLNSNTPGVYIIDFNDTPPPPPPCPTCTQRIESVVCQAIRLQTESDGITVPHPCQDTNQ